jgi:hypothetical protein
MPQWQLNQLSDLCHLLPAATNVVVTDFVEVTLLVFALNGLTLAVDDSILCDDAELWWVNLNDLKLYLSHTTAGCEGVALANRSVGFAEVWGEENVEQRTGDTLDGIGDGEDCNALGLRDSQFPVGVSR